MRISPQFYRGARVRSSSAIGNIIGHTSQEKETMFAPEDCLLWSMYRNVAAAAKVLICYRDD